MSTMADRKSMKKTELEIREAIMSMKMKNSKGYDRIPQRIMIDGISELMEPFVKLYKLTMKKLFLSFS